MRCFIALPIEGDIKTQLIKAQQELKSTKANLKLVEEENIHLTLKFLGEVESEKASKVCESLQEIKFPRFDIVVEGIGVFPNFNFLRVIWAGISKGAENILKLHEELEKKLAVIGFKRDANFHPHVTLARVRSPHNKTALVSKIKEFQNTYFGQVSIDKILFMESKLKPSGPVYSVIKDVKLY